jgi:hypothetical protein
MTSKALHAKVLEFAHAVKRFENWDGRSEGPPRVEVEFDSVWKLVLWEEGFRFRKPRRAGGVSPLLLPDDQDPREQEPDLTSADIQSISTVSIHRGVAQILQHTLIDIHSKCCHADGGEERTHDAACESSLYPMYCVGSGTLPSQTQSGDQHTFRISHSVWCRQRNNSTLPRTAHPIPPHTERCPPSPSSRMVPTH